MIWQQSLQLAVPGSLRVISQDERTCTRPRHRDLAQNTDNPQKRNRLISHRQWNTTDASFSCRSLVDEPLRKRRRGQQDSSTSHVLSTSVVDLLDFFKCYPGLKWTIGSRLLRYYNPETARPLPSAGQNLRARNTQMMDLLSPNAAATTLLQLKQEMQLMKLSYDEDNRARTDCRSTYAPEVNESMQETVGENKPSHINSISLMSDHQNPKVFLISPE